MNRQYRVYFATCEGKSEENYLQRLNSFLKERGVRCSFKIVGKGMGGGAVADILKRKHRSCRYSRTDARFFLLDRDRVQRGELGLRDVEAIDPHACIWLNTQNFEDFLALHADADTLRAWLPHLQLVKHFSQPLHSEQYLFLYQQAFPGYRKGSLPLDFDFGVGLANLRSNYLWACVTMGAETENEFARFMLENILPLLEVKA